jgi:TetR/AcrR family transcriptional regulator, mexJK operon transcriptional repressor
MESVRRKRVTGGRPTREEAELLSEKIVDVAAQLMLEHGYSGTSIEAIANLAGVAKRTLYHRFPDKRDLFAAVVQRRSDQFLSPVARISAAGGDIEQRLRLIGRHMLDWGMQSDAMSLKRLLAAEAERFPELLATVYEDSRDKTIETLADILQREVERGVLSIPDPKFAALQFLQMVMGPAELLAHRRHHHCSGTGRQEYVDKTVQLFLNGCRTRPD